MIASSIKDQANNRDEEKKNIFRHSIRRLASNLHHAKGWINQISHNLASNT